MPKLFSCEILVAFAVLFLSLSDCSNVLAAPSYIVAGGETKTINEWNMCQKVTSATGWPYPIFIPTNSQIEWTAFQSNRPSHIALASCSWTASDATISLYTSRVTPGAVINIKSLPAQIQLAGTIYTISLNGSYIKIQTNSFGLINAIGIQIAGVDTMWADKVISYKIGSGVMAPSIYNLLYEPDSLYTAVGKDGEVTVGFPRE